MIKIYTNSDVCRWHLNQIPCEITDNPTSGNPAVFHLPFPYTEDFQTQINQALDVCSLVVILVSELHRDSVDFILNNQQSKIRYFTCGNVQGVKTFKWMDWFITTTEFYKHNDILEKLFPYRQKTRVFDILLGWAKPHRQKIYDYVLANKLCHHTVMTYLQDRSLPLQDQLADSWIWPNIPVPKEHYKNTITNVNYKNQDIALSQIIPIDIYNQSTYSIVAETNYDNDYSFYTEKIVKPILARRLFIVFSGQYYLRNLQNMGFQTFNGIIDETYDEVEDSDQRFSMALSQMHQLIDMPQWQVLEKIEPIVEHNYNLMMSKDWYGDFAREFQALVLGHVEQN